MINVVILAGGSISDKLGFLRSRCPSPALIPVNTRPLAAYIIDFYAAQKDCRVRLAVNENVQDAVLAELGTMEGRYELKLLGETAGVVDSLAQATRDLPPESDVIVNLVTTVPVCVVKSGEVLIADHPSHSTHWSGISIDSGRPAFSFKSAPLSAPSNAFTGVFRCSNASLSAAIGAATKLNDLLSVIEQLQIRHPMRYTPCEWIDCGHETSYYEARAKLISSRSFNRIRVSLEDGVLWKSSGDIAKLRREVEYMEMLPPAIRVYFPRVLNDRAISGAEGVQMEYYGYPSVAEYLLYWDLSPANWQRLFSRLQTALHRFTAFPYSISQGAFEGFHLEKTIKRIEQFMGGIDPGLQRTLEGELVINGRKCKPFKSLVHKLGARLSGMYRESDFCVMHGDFCFNNILYDVPSGIVRLIDPRGSFGDHCVGIHGDRKYDLAKLKHSAEHGYDFLVNGLFILRNDGAKFDYTFSSRECCSLVAALSRETIAGAGCDNTEIELLASLLFLSMCPLHSENAARQITMYVHGLRLLNISLEN